MKTIVIILLGLMLVPSLIYSQNECKITYISNEGFLIEADGKKVLIDALFDKIEGNWCDSPSENTIELMRLAPRLILILADRWWAILLTEKGPGVSLHLRELVLEDPPSLVGDGGHHFSLRIETKLSGSGWIRLRRCAHQRSIARRFSGR